MSCLKYIGSFILFSVFFSFVSVSSSYALNDISHTFLANELVSANTVIFPDCDIDCLSEYNYFIISAPGYNSNFNSTLNLHFGSGNYCGNVSLYLVNSLYYPDQFMRQGCDSSGFLSIPSAWRPSSNVIFTFSDSLPGTDCPDSPSGVISIIENGTYDVSNYSSADVNVPVTVISETPYDDKLIAIKNAILIIPATLLVIYFFYCIYRLIIKNSGVN